MAGAADSTAAGQELRLRQEYFFVSASLQDLIRRHIKQFGSIETLADLSRGARAAGVTAPINRQAVVSRHDVHLTTVDPEGAVSVGNGAYTQVGPLRNATNDAWQVHLAGGVTGNANPNALLLANAPELVHPLEFIVPFYRIFEREFMRIGLGMYDALAGRRNRRFRHIQPATWVAEHWRE